MERPLKKSKQNRLRPRNNTRSQKGIVIKSGVQMKKIIIPVIIVIFLSAVSFAKQPSEQNIKANEIYALKMVQTKEFTGEVKKATIADPVKGTKSEVMVADEKSGEKIFLVKTTTTVYDVDFKAMTFERLKADDKLKVRYITTKEGVNEAVSINLIK
jgi:hypothetical protein